MSDYLHTFLMNEVRLRAHTELDRWQEQFTRLFNFVLRHAMPMEQLQIATFREAVFQSRNAEEALLVALNVCAQTIGRRSIIQQPDPTTFGTWLMRMEGQRDRNGRLARRSRSFLTLPSVHLFSNDLYRANLICSDLEELQANFLYAGFANLSSANLKNATLMKACLPVSNLSNTDLSNTSFEEADLMSAYMRRANLTGADLRRANLEGADLTEANLTNANLTRANLTDANLTGANLTNANLAGANLERTNLKRCEGR